MAPADILSLRRELEFRIEAMIALLDLIDGDPDLEPYLAGFEKGFRDDREDEAELLEDSDEDSAVDDFPIDDDELCVDEVDVVDQVAA